MKEHQYQVLKYYFHLFSRNYLTLNNLILNHLVKCAVRPTSFSKNHPSTSSLSFEVLFAQEKHPTLRRPQERENFLHQNHGNLSNNHQKKKGRRFLWGGKVGLGGWGWWWGPLDSHGKTTHQQGWSVTAPVAPEFNSGNGAGIPGIPRWIWMDLVPLKNGGWKTFAFPIGFRSLFRGYVKLRGCILNYPFGERSNNGNLW